MFTLRTAQIDHASGFLDGTADRLLPLRLRTKRNVVFNTVASKGKQLNQPIGLAEATAFKSNL